MGDIFIKDHGTILIFVPATEAGMEWMDQNIDPGAMRWAGGIVVEPRYAGPIIEGAAGDGLSVTF